MNAHHPELTALPRTPAAVAMRAKATTRRAWAGMWMVAGLLLAALAPAWTWAKIAIVGGKVHTLTDAGVREGVTLLLRDGRIEAIHRRQSVPRGYLRIDATDKVVTPGLIESFSHLGLVEISLEAGTDDSAFTDAEGVLPHRVGPSLDVSLALNPTSTLIPVNAMDGVLRAITAPRAGIDPLAGLAASVRLGPGAFLLQPRIALVGYMGAEAARFAGGNRAALLGGLHAALEQASAYNAGGGRLDDGEYSRRDMAALAQFMASGQPLLLQADQAAQILRALDLAAAHGRQPIILGGAEAWQVRERLAAESVPVIVRPHANLPRSFEQLGARLDNAALLHAAGVPVLFTAGNTHNARNLRQLAGSAVTHGMPWEAALEAMTRRPASVWGMADVGVIEVGAVADLVIWTGDPLEVTTWAETVVIDGEVLPSRSRQTALFERYRDLGRPYGYYQ